MKKAALLSSIAFTFFLVISYQNCGSKVESVILIDGDIVAPSGTIRGLASAQGVEKWPNGVIPYVFNSDVSSSYRSSFINTCSMYELATGLRCVPRTTESKYSTVSVANLGTAGLCAASLGSLVGSTIYIQQCGGGTNSGVSAALIHELGHAFGFIHEHQRSDRDNYITINWSSIDPAWTSAYQLSTNSTLLGSYDIKSRMHYGQSTFLNFSVGGQTFTPKPSQDILNKQRGSNESFLSPNDAIKMAGFYGKIANPLPQHKIGFVTQQPNGYITIKGWSADSSNLAMSTTVRILGRKVTTPTSQFVVWGQVTSNKFFDATYDYDFNSYYNTNHGFIFPKFLNSGQYQVAIETKDIPSNRWVEALGSANITVSSTYPAYDANTLVNGDFEDIVTRPWNLKDLLGVSANSTFYSCPSPASGSRCGKLDLTSSTAFYAVAPVKPSLSPNATYLVSVDIRTSDQLTKPFKGHAYLNYEFMNSSGSVIGSGSIADVISANTKWTNYNKEIFAPTGSSKLNLFIAVTQGVGTASFDNITVQKKK